LNRHDAGGRFDSIGRFHLDRQPVFVTGPVDPDLIADHKRCQQCKWPEPFEVHAVRPSSVRSLLIAWHNGQAGVKPALLSA
jgi:hypothetical protein